MENPGSSRLETGHQTFSYWQLLKIRAALIDLSRYGDDGRGMSDARLATEIAAWAEVKSEDEASLRNGLKAEIIIGKEAIRRFKNGFYIDDDTGRIKEPDSIEHIVNYVTHPDVGALDQDELKRECVPFLPPLRFAQFLHPDPILPVPKALNGIFRAERRDGKLLTRKHLSLMVHPDGVLIHVEEIDNCFEVRENGSARFLRQHERTGWGVLTPEDYIYMFLKHKRREVNSYYFSFFQAEDFWTAKKIDRLHATEQLGAHDVRDFLTPIVGSEDINTIKDINQTENSEHRESLIKIISYGYFEFKRTSDFLLHQNEVFVNLKEDQSEGREPGMRRVGRDGVLDDLRRIFRFSPTSEKVRGTLSDREHARLGKKLMRAADTGDPSQVQAALDAGAPVNYADPRTGDTVLHVIAAGRAREALRVLMKRDDLMYWVRNKNDRLPSDLANMTSDVVMGRFLMIQEAREAKAAGVNPTRRHDVPLPPEL